MSNYVCLILIIYCYFKLIYVIAVTLQDAYRRSCPNFENRWSMPNYEYVIPKGGFCSDYCVGAKNPLWFECDEDIMPKIQFYGYSTRTLSNGDPGHCTVETKKGNSDKKVKECLDYVKKSLTDTKQPDAKLVYIVHGYKGHGGVSWIRNLKNNLFKKNKKGSIVVGIVSWKSGARLIYPNLGKKKSSAKSRRIDIPFLPIPAKIHVLLSAKIAKSKKES